MLTKSQPFDELLDRRKNNNIIYFDWFLILNHFFYYLSLSIINDMIYLCYNFKVIFFLFYFFE